MTSRWIAMRKSLVPRVALISSFILLLGMLALAFFTIRYHETQSRKNATASADLLGSTIRMGTHYAMMLNAREDLNQIIRKMGQQEEIVQLRIVSKSGEIKFSKNEAEIGTMILDQAPECRVCHRMTPPLSAKSRPPTAPGCCGPQRGTGRWASSAPSTTSPAAPARPAMSIRPPQKSWEFWTWLSPCARPNGFSASSNP